MKFGIAHGFRLCGIYEILNAANGKFYVGSSVNVEGRIFKHLSALRRGVHKNAHLQAAFTKYGEDAFEYLLIEVCEPPELLAREQHNIDALQPDYNICKVAGNTLGVLHSPESRLKMSAANKGNKRRLGKQHSDATKLLLSELATQRRATAETKAKLSMAMKGNRHTAGRPLSEEHRAKVGYASRAAWACDERKAEAAARARARWADPIWRAAQAERIRAGRAAAQAVRS